ncbi:MAG: zf-HC2 domain-containing protein [Myxococcus sp.]|nr:zf-HC2 domain-containing protein [Myxococcus sp.]
MSAGVHHYEDKLLDYAYGELSAHEASAVDAHVRTCTKCSQALEQIRGVRSVFAPLPMVAAPDAGLESLLGYAEQHANRSKAARQAPWRRWLFVLGSAAALVVVGVVAVRASDSSPQHASELLAAAEKEARMEERKPQAPAAVQPVAATPAEAEPVVDAPTWDERTAKRGSREAGAEAKAKSIALGDLAEEQAEPARDRTAEPQKEPARKRLEAAQTRQPAEKLGADKGGADALAAKDLTGAGRASAAKREQLAAGGEEELRLDYGNAGRGVALEGLKSAKKRPANNIDDQLNDGTTARQGLGGTASGPGFGVSTGSSGLFAAPADDAPTAGKKADLARAEAPPPPPAQASPEPSAPSKPAAMPAPKTARSAGSSYGLPRSAPSSMDDEVDSALVTESVSKSADGDASRQRAQQRDVEAQLAQARSAANSGDRRAEVMAAVGALNAGATGYSRAEALKRACDGYEAMSEFDRAQPFCERLLAEFPGTAAARQVADRRKQLKAGPARSKAAADQEAKPAEAIQAQ